MGETAAKLRLIFDSMNEVRGVYFFDEFDAIGSQRAAPGDVGEIRRVLTSFLQFIEEDASDSLLIAATNHQALLDRALFRRFDDVVCYPMPSIALIEEVLRRCLSPFKLEGLDLGRLAERAEGLSHADLVRACQDAAKETILADREHISAEAVERALAARRRTNQTLGTDG